MLEFYLEDREIRQAEFLANRKKEILERKERQEKLLAERRAQLADREVPYQREQETIQHLIRYLHKMKV